MNKVWAQPLRRQLFIAILLMLVPVVGAAIWSGLVTVRERTDELRHQTRVVAITVASYMNRNVASLDRMVEDLVEDAAVMAVDPRAVADLFARTVAGSPIISGVLLVDSDGLEVARAGPSAAFRGHPARWAREALKTGRRVVSPTQITPEGPDSIVIAYPVRDRARVVAALSLFLQPTTTQDLFASLPLPPGSVVTVTDGAGRILVRSLDAERYVGEILTDAAPASLVVRPPEERDSVDGTRRMYGEALVDAGPWMVSVGIPMSTAVGRAALVWVRSATIFGLGLAGWLAVAFVMSRRLAASVSHLDAAAQRIAGGDFTPFERKPMASREFADLQDAFAQMLSRFNQARAALDEQMAEERGIRQELQMLQRQVIRQERLAAVGQLVSGVAHEINNPLQAILGFAELLQMQSRLPDSVKDDLNLIQKESARACGIIRNLALFARQQTGEAAPVRPTDVVNSVVELRQRRLETEDIELRVEDTSRRHVLAVFTELQQVVLNFVVNAEQAIVMSGRQPGCITVRTRDEDHRVIVEVEDTGPGIPPENEAKLFQPFFTTKPVGQGTGLGLSVSYGIIDSLGGRIGYRSAPAGGALFYVDLPAASA